MLQSFLFYSEHQGYGVLGATLLGQLQEVPNRFLKWKLLLPGVWALWGRIGSWC